MLIYNLQFFAKEGMGGEKTEPATAKKLQDARKEGQVAKSKEIGNGLGLLTFFFVLKVFVGSIGTNLMEVFSLIYERIPDYLTLSNGKLEVSDMTLLLQTVLIEMLGILFPIFAIGALVALVVELAQVKWEPTGKPLKPKFNRMNPISGFKRIISGQSLAELIKSIARILLVVYVVYTSIKDELPTLLILYDMPLTQALVLIGNLTIDLGIKISAIYMIIAAGDYIYQKWKFNNDQKMTKQEVKEEYKNAEGNPEVKGKIRQKMREVSQRRMMQNLPKADVVITNPTHFAVALQYDLEVASAPIVLAKGQDFLAQRIKEVAKENKIEIVENKPLARMLYANVEVGEQIPEEMYQAVAEILSVIYHMQNRV